MQNKLLHCQVKEQEQLISGQREQILEHNQEMNALEGRLAMHRKHIMQSEATAREYLDIIEQQNMEIQQFRTQCIQLKLENSQVVEENIK